jgi:hypothetical protein
MRTTRHWVPARWALPTARSWPRRAGVRPARTCARIHPAEKVLWREGQYTATRNASPRCGTQRSVAARICPPCTGVHTTASRSHDHLHRFNTALWRAPARGGRRGLDRGAGVCGHRHRDLLPAQPNTAQRPTPGTQGTTRARRKARRRVAG